MDTVVLQEFQGERSSASASCTGLQYGELPAHIGLANIHCRLVSDEPAGSDDQDRCESCTSRPFNDPSISRSSCSPRSLGTDAGNNCCSEGKGSSTVTTDIIRHHPDCAHGARKGIATPVVPKKRQILTAVASKSWQTDRTAHQASEALEKGGVYAKVVIGSGPIWEISGYRSQLCRGDNLCQS